MKALSYQPLHRQLRKQLITALPATFAAVVLSNLSPVLISSQSLSSVSSEVLSGTSDEISQVGISQAISWGQSAKAQSSTQVALQLDWSALEQQIIVEHNQIRQDPQSYIPRLEAYMATMNEDGHIVHGCGQNCVLATQEGQAAVQEAIAFLQQQAPVGPISPSPAVAQAAKALARDQRSGEIGHVSSDGTSFLQRLSQFGIESSRIGENISYGSTSAEEVVMRLLIDDGIPERAHRQNLFSPTWTNAGAGCGAHATYRSVCVIDYATNY